MTQNKRILITGAAGFIGFHTARQLQKNNHFVVGLDNFNDYYSRTLKKDRSQLLKNEGVEVIQGDICDLSLLNEMIQKYEITHLLHLAAQAGVRYSIDQPSTYVKSNLEGFVNVLEACRAQKGIKCIYASSSSVYGLNTKTPFSLDDRTDHPVSLYGATKKANELIAHAYHHLFNLPLVGLRFFTVYGPWGRPDMAYFKFAKAMTENQPIPVFNHGKMKRDFTYIDDVVDGIIAAIDFCNEGFHTFNLGNNQSEALEDMISYLEQALKITAEKNYLPMQSGDVIQTYADISVSEELLHFSPKVSLKEGLQKFADWYLQYAPHSSSLQ